MFVLRPLAQRPIALLWTGQVLAATGAEFYMVAVVWIAADFVGRDAGYVSAFQAGALLVGSLFGGILTDRWRHGPTMISADLLRAALMLLLSIAGALQFLSLPLLVAVAGGVALLTSVFEPALQASLPAIATDAALRHATNGLFDATKRMARILGPSMIALVNGFLPKTQFFTVTGATFLLSALAVRASAHAWPRETRHRQATGAAGVIDGLLGGMRGMRGHAVMIYGMVAGLIGNLTWAMGILLGMVLYLRETSAAPLTDYGLMMTAYGVGNLATNLVLASAKPHRPATWLIASKLIFGAGVFMLPLAHGRVELMLIAALAATNGPFENLAMLHLMQTRFQPHRIAQIYRLQMCAVFSGVLAAYLMSPSLFGWFGLAPTIMGGGAATFAIGLVGVGLAVWKRRRATRMRPV